MSKYSAAIGSLVLLFSASIASAQSQIRDVFALEYVGVRQEIPSSSFVTLDFTQCNTSSTNKHALLFFDFIGNGAEQVPAGSTITDARLFTTGEVSGDGNLYRCNQAWSSTSTWANLVGGADHTGTPIPFGTNAGVEASRVVTSIVSTWMGNPASNNGFVMKGAINDCPASRIYNPDASAGLRPFLRITFTPPPTVRVSGVTIGSSVSVDPDYSFATKVGSGEQLRTVPVGRIDEFLISFSSSKAPDPATGGCPERS